MLYAKENDFSTEEVDANGHRWPVYPTNGSWRCLNCGCGSFSSRGLITCNGPRNPDKKDIPE